MAKTIEEVAKRFVELTREEYKKKTSEELPEHWARILEKGFCIGAAWQNIVGADAVPSPVGEEKGEKPLKPTTKLSDKTICGS